MENTAGLRRFSLRILIVMVFDVLLVSLSFFASYTFIAQLDERINADGNLYVALLIYDVLFFITSLAFGGYTKKTLATALRFGLTTIFATGVTTVISYCLFAIVLEIHFGFGMILMAALTGMLVIISRLVQKFLLQHYFYDRDDEGKNIIPTLIIGAGFTGKMVYRELTEGVENDLKPVCFVDDDKHLISTEVCNLPVYGPTVLIPQLCKKYRIGMIIFAIPSCSKEQRNRILANCKGTDCDIRIIPSLKDLTVDAKILPQAVSVDVEKLLGRDAIKINNSKVSAFIENKVCLVTGGGGSIGSELCRQIVRMSPKKLVILDIYENNAYDIQQELRRAGYSDDKVSVEIASVRDKEKMRAIFKKYGFDVVFHAAAHKHVPLMENSPEEAVKNNICGTYNIAHFAHQFGVKKMVLISTDKAVNPTNVMGATKRACEMVMQYMAQRYSETVYTAVRFGNVLGSNGSVIPLFTNQIKSGGPVTVTHPDIIRYFMTIPEAVSLVLEAGTMSTGGETFVLDMGEPVKIVTLAENLIKMHGYEPYKDIAIEFCGLREGEKLFEELLMGEENLKKTHNKKIFISDQLEIDCDLFIDKVDTLISAAQKNDSEETVECLHKLIDTYKTPEEINGEATNFEHPKMAVKS